MRLLLAEDDLQLQASLKHSLETNNYLVDTVANGSAALTYAESGEYDALIFEISLPNCAGLDVLQALRAQGFSTPLLLLTSPGNVDERVLGLDAGADDCLAKPFATTELLARVRAMLRRKDTYSPDVLEFSGLVLDRSAFALCVGNKHQNLSAKEYQIIEFFMNHPAMIISANKLLTHIWGWESEVNASVLWVHISNLRKKFAALNAPCVIRFVRGAGYILEQSS